MVPVGLVVSFFNQINHVLAENNFCLLMASPAFEVPHGTAGFEVGSEKRTSLFVECMRACVCVRVCFSKRERERSVKHSFHCCLRPETQRRSYDKNKSFGLVAC